MTPGDRLDYVKAILAAPELTTTEKLVGAALAATFHNSNNGRCDPSYETLGAAVGVQRRATLNAVQTLADHGWLEIQRRVRPGRSHTNQFVLVLGKAKERVHGGTLFDDAERVHGDAPIVGKGCTAEHERVHSGAPEPSVNTQRRGGRPGALARAPALPLDSSFREWWAEYPERKRQGEAAARREFCRVVESGEATPETLVGAVKRYAAACGARETHFIAEPSNWLRKRQWTQEPVELALRSPRGRNPAPEPRTDGLSGMTGLALQMLREGKFS